MVSVYGKYRPTSAIGTLVLTSIVTSLLLPAIASAAASQTPSLRIKRVTNAVGVSTSPSATATKIVYEDSRNGHVEIYLYDSATDTERRITDSVSAKGGPSLSGSNIVWSDGRNGLPSDNDLYAYNLDSRSTTRLSKALGSQQTAHVDGRRVVYSDFRNGNWDVYLYDFTARREFQITHNLADQRMPRISGNNVVWDDSRNGGRDIYAYNIATKREKRISPLQGDDYRPDISGSGVVWASNANGNLDIYYHNLSTGQSRRLTYSTTNQTEPRISGSRVVWRDYRSSASAADIVLHDLPTKVTRSVAAHAADQSRPDIDGNRIAWVDSRNGNEEIYTATFPASTLTMTANASTVTYGQKVTFRGRIANASGDPIPNRLVTLERSYDGKNWHSAGSYKDSDGLLERSIAPSRRSWYRFRFAGDAYYASSTSSIYSVTVTPVVTTPKFSKSAVPGRTFTVRGYLKPRHTANSKTISLKIYRWKSGGSWTYYKSVRATNSNYNGYTKYSARLKLAKGYAYYFVAKHPADSRHLSAKSPSSKVLNFR